MRFSSHLDQTVTATSCGYSAFQVVPIKLIEHKGLEPASRSGLFELASKCFWHFHPHLSLRLDVRYYPPPTDIVAVTVGAGHELAIKSDGTVWNWGFNLGDARSGETACYGFW